MKKMILSLACMLASFGAANATTTASVNAMSDVTTVSDADTYNGTATIEKMNDKTMSGNYSAAFTYDAETGEISGSVNVAGGIMEFTLDGTITGSAGTATGVAANAITGNKYPYTAVLSDVVASGDSLSFRCVATITSTGKQSIFTFKGTK